MLETIEKLLTEKYGLPIYKEAKRVVSWKLANTSIDLRHMTLPNLGFSQVLVSYKPSTASGKAARDL